MTNTPNPESFTVGPETETQIVNPRVGIPEKDQHQFSAQQPRTTEEKEFPDDDAQEPV